jgi:hypothetical protein
MVLFMHNNRIMQIHPRLRPAVKAAGAHFILSLIVAAIAASTVFGVWYPFPYSELSGGRELFILVITVDVICGPLLTLVLFNPAKPRYELVRDLTLVAIIQLMALGYGMWTVWQARPLFLVHEVDRFKVVTAPDVAQFDLAKLQDSIQPRSWAGPITVGLRPPKDAKEREKVLFESIQGGADYAERPEFYLPYEGNVALNSLAKTRNVVDFIQRYPEQTTTINEISRKSSVPLNELKYAPVVARADWIALLNKQGNIVGFVPGDGF